MKNKVSELMDGELDQHDSAHVIEAIKKNHELWEDWNTYHLIGDSLRRSSFLSMNTSSNISQKLKTEPTVLSPKTSSNSEQKQKYKVFAFSAAASVIAMIAGGIAMNHLYEPRQMIIAEQQHKQDLNNRAMPLMISTPPAVHHFAYPPVEINDYLFVHREFSPGITARNHVTNINSVSEYHERYGR
ncbi:MAG: sigma-E factor negative regulatory protein [Nitrosomonas sp.]|nr:MAG: sigma-E factor negative regulatory protein [Nitrosomonas sp.]